DRALAQAARAERLAIERTDILRREPAHVHPANQRLHIRRPGAQPLHRRRLKSLVRAAELRDREVQHPGLALDALRLVPIPPASARAIATPVMPPPQK